MVYSLIAYKALVTQVPTNMQGQYVYTRVCVRWDKDIKLLEYYRIKCYLQQNKAGAMLSESLGDKMLVSQLESVGDLRLNPVFLISWGK